MREFLKHVLAKAETERFFALRVLIGETVFSVGLSLWHKDVHWALIVMAAVSVALFIIGIITLGGELLREIKRCFHTR